MVPPLAAQVTAVLVVPVTVAVNCCVAPAKIAADGGFRLTTTTGGGVLTVTVAVTNLLLSAKLVARTVNVPAVAGAVYKPEVEIVPPVADQVTAVLLVPLTVAVNC